MAQSKNNRASGKFVEPMEVMEVPEEKQKLNNSLKLLFKSSIAVFFGMVLSKIFAYSYRIMIARNFGPEAYGLFSLSLMVVGWFVLFSTLGVTQGVLRYIALYRGKNEHDKIRHTFKFALIALSTISILSGLILFFSAGFISVNFFHSPDLIPMLKIFSIAIPLTVLMNLHLSAIQAFEKIGWYSFIFNILQNFVKVASLVVLILIGFSAISIGISYVLGIFVSLAVAYLVCRHVIKELFGENHLGADIKKKLTEDLLSYSLPLLFFGLITSLFYWTDTFIIGYFKTATDVGLYSAAISIAILFSLTSDLFMQLFFPLVTKEYAQGNIKLVRELSKQVGKWIFAINLPVMVLIMIFPGTLINLLFGSEFLVMENSLRILAIGSFISSILIISNNLITISGRPKIVLYDILGVSILNAILGIILINKLGVEGVALATMISLIVLNLIFLLQSHKYVSIVPLRRKMLQILALAVIPGVLLFFARNQVIEMNIQIVILLFTMFCTAYVFLLSMTECFDENDMTIINYIRDKITGAKRAQ